MATKLSKLSKVLIAAQESLALLNAYGIDIDRLIGISNAPGPLAKVIRAVLFAEASKDDIDFAKSLETKNGSRRSLIPSSRVRNLNSSATK